jgi:hypothetical protein
VSIATWNPVVIGVVEPARTTLKMGEQELRHLAAGGGHGEDVGGGLGQAEKLQLGEGLRLAAFGVISIFGDQAGLGFKPELGVGVGYVGRTDVWLPIH